MSNNSSKKKKTGGFFYRFITTIFFLLLIFFIAYSIYFKVFHDKLNMDIKNKLITSLKREAHTSEPQQEKVENKEPAEIINKVSMLFTGDIMCHNTQFKDAYSNGTYDFKYVFDDIKDSLSSTDITVGNLETTFAGAEKGYSGYPQFNTPSELGSNLKDVGFDILTTSNNHSLDTGYTGLEKTLNTLDELSIRHTGTSRSEEEQNTVLFYETNGMKIAFIAATYGTNGIPVPSSKPYCINLISKEFLLSQIQKAQAGNPDAIIACMHWGEEYNTKYTTSQTEMADFLFENGVDIIIGNHPHVLEPMETRDITTKDGKNKKVFLVYSLGNFMSGQTQKNTRTSILLNLEISKSNKNEFINIDNISYIPIYTHSNNFKNYKILDINKAISEYQNGNKYISADTYSTLTSEIQRLNEMYKNMNSGEEK